MLYNIPIEPFEERYSGQWANWFPKEFVKRNVLYRTILGEKLTEGITNGSFLDICGTHYWKAEQIKQLCKLAHEGQIKDHDILFFHDLWFPGLEALAYIRDGLKINFKITGILHAGTYTPHDPITRWGMGSWGESLENSWFSFVDKIFVATNYHKNLILENRVCDSDKIAVTGLPIYFSDYPGFPDLHVIDKELQVVFPHRLEPERQPWLFDILANECKNIGYNFVKTKEICGTKQEYLETLAKSRVVVSTAIQETWGIAIQEAMFYDCLPVVPNEFSYQELYYPCFRYNAYDEMKELVLEMIRNSKAFESERRANKEFLIRRGEIAIDNILMELWKLERE